MSFLTPPPSRLFTVGLLSSPTVKRHPLRNEAKKNWQLIFIYVRLCVDTKICIINNYLTFDFLPKSLQCASATKSESELLFFMILKQHFFFVAVMWFSPFEFLPFPLMPLLIHTETFPPPACQHAFLLIRTTNPAFVSIYWGLKYKKKKHSDGTPVLDVGWLISVHKFLSNCLLID